MQIPSAAKKCPHCQHFQNKLSMIMFHPAFVAAFAFIPIILFWILFAKMFDKGEDYKRYSDQIEITESRIAFGETKSGATVGVIGNIRSRSSIPWKDIRFQVDFQDAKGQTVDTAQREEYSYCVPAGASLPFKVSFRREFPETNYVHHIVRIVSATDGRTRW